MATDFLFTMHDGCRLEDITEACRECGSTETMTKCEWCLRAICPQHDFETEEGSGVYACDSCHDEYLRNCIGEDAREEL